ncbi:MAG: HAD family hydrolase [Thermodesulfobacteriota bacterium]|nr:HAD family hydrolase [Thermodesulfobacteriota bacterium]
MQNIQTIKGVLFDLDGTLTWPGALDFPAIKRELCCPQDQPILEYLESRPKSLRTELMKILEQREEQAAKASVPNKGAEKCLSVLINKGVSLGILTRNSLDSVKIALQQFEDFELDDFAAVITRDFSLPKPHPDGVFQAARKMGLLPSELLVVGDFCYDIIAGKAAGSLTVFVTNNQKSVMVPGDSEPDYTISYLSQLLDIPQLFEDSVQAKYGRAHHSWPHSGS